MDKTISPIIRTLYPPKKCWQFRMNSSCRTNHLFIRTSLFLNKCKEICKDININFFFLYFPRNDLETGQHKIRAKYRVFGADCFSLTPAQLSWDRSPRKFTLITRSHLPSAPSRYFKLHINAMTLVGRRQSSGNSQQRRSRNLSSLSKDGSHRIQWHRGAISATTLEIVVERCPSESHSVVEQMVLSMKATERWTVSYECIGVSSEAAAAATRVMPAEGNPPIME